MPACQPKKIKLPKVRKIFAITKVDREQEAWNEWYLSMDLIKSKVSFDEEPLIKPSSLKTE